MEHLDKNILTKWRVNDVIREKTTGHPFLVLHIYKFMCTIIVDLEDHTPLRPMLTLLPERYDEYATDWEMKAEEKKRGDSVDLDWKYSPIFI